MLIAIFLLGVSTIYLGGGRVLPQRRRRVFDDMQDLMNNMQKQQLYMDKTTGTSVYNP